MSTRLSDWEGQLPELGEYLQTTFGTTYLVLGCRPTRPGSQSVAVLDIARLDSSEKAEMPAGATIHGFQWNPRG